jgi:serine protease
MDPSWPTRTIDRPTQTDGVHVIKVSRVNALCASIALAMAGSSFAASDNGTERVWVKFSPGAKANVGNALRAAGGNIHHEFDELGAFAVSLPTQALNGLRSNPHVEYIEEDVIREPMAQTVPYGIPMVQAPQAWTAGGDGSGILVCVVDSGINPNHEDLGNITGGYPSNWNSDTCGHGTHVAGSVGALNNTTGVVGVAPNASFYIVRVFAGGNDGCGWAYSSTLVDAANRCKSAADAQGKRLVINMSLGGGTSSTTESNGFATLYNTGSVLSIAAAGNAGNTTMSYPASYNSVMSVAAIDSNKALASFSQRNSQVEIAAPGVDVLSTMPFTDASVTVAGVGYIVSSMDGTFRSSATAALASGGRCTANNSTWSGKVVLCERGDIAFADKAKFVQQSGGVGVIVYNNEPGSFGGTLGSFASTVPTVSMSQADGQFLLANRIGSSTTISTIMTNPASGYGLMSGTSMASPHAAGAAAAIWSTNPAATNAEVRSAMTTTAEDLGTSGRDNSFGWGLVRTANAIAALNGTGGGGGEEPGNVTATVASVGLSFSKKGQNNQARADVSVVAAGAPLGGASVSGCFSGAVSGCGTGTTNSSGAVSFSSGNFRSGSVQFCVTSVSKNGYTFQSSSNDCKTATP